MHFQAIQIGSNIYAPFRSEGRSGGTGVTNRGGSIEDHKILREPRMDGANGKAKDRSRGRNSASRSRGCGRSNMGIRTNLPDHDAPFLGCAAADGKTVVE